MERIKMDESEGLSEYMDTKRLETLVDGIFAIAMTLLVLGLAVPQINVPLSNAVVSNTIYNLIPNFISLVISFILLAIFWKIHHRIFKQINKMNGTLLWDKCDLAFIYSTGSIFLHFNRGLRRLSHFSHYF